jgi:hypothetical protein
MKLFSQYKLATKARKKYKGCDVKKEFCLACVEESIRRAFEMGRSGKYI